MWGNVARPLLTYAADKSGPRVSPNVVKIIHRGMDSIVRRPAWKRARWPLLYADSVNSIYSI